MKRKGRKRARGRATRRRTATAGEGRVHVGELLQEVASHPETGPPLSGGDVDADWQRAWSSGEEAVGGSAATPDQDVVDEIGRALGVEQPAEAPLRTSGEILRDRDRRYWKLEGRAARKAAREEA